MIDTWFFTALCLILLTLAVLIRAIRIQAFYDRILAAMIAVTLAGMSGLLLSISQGSLLLLELAVVVVLIGYAAVIGYGKFSGGVKV